MYENKFALIRKGPTDKYHQQIKTIRNHPKLFHDTDNKEINQKYVRELSYKGVRNNSGAPTVRPLPTIHKENTLIRPVVNFTNSQTYIISKYITYPLNKKIKL